MIEIQNSVESDSVVERRFKPWDELTFADDFMFCKIMMNKEICISVLERLLHIKIKDITYLTEQKSITPSYDSKGVRLDVYLADSDHIFDVEMQTTRRSDLSKRSRYYQSLMDIDSIKKGQSYNTLKDSYVIFICMFDPFEKGLPVYSFQNTCKENTSIKLNDRSFKVFYNATGYEKEKDAEISAFLKYLCQGEGKTNLTVAIKNHVQELKGNESWRSEYMTLEMIEEEIREKAEKYYEKVGIEKGIQKGIAQGLQQGIVQGVQQGIAQGREEGIIQTAYNLKVLGLSLEKIVQATGLSMEEVVKL